MWNTHWSLTLKPKDLNPLHKNVTNKHIGSLQDLITLLLLCFFMGCIITYCKIKSLRGKGIPTVITPHFD